MRAWRELSPMQLGRWIVAGQLSWVGSTWVYLVAKLVAAPPHRFSLTFGFDLLLLLGGATVWIIAERQLSEGVKNERWPNAELMQLDRSLQQSIFLRTLGGVLVAWIAVVVATRSWHTLRFWTLAAYFYPWLTYSRIRDQVAKVLSPKPSAEGSYKPLRSNYWGKRSTD